MDPARTVRTGKEIKTVSDIYIYDEIVMEKYTDWDGNDHGFTPKDMSDVLLEAQAGETVKLYVNSPGGSVFAAVAMTSEIRRAVKRGVNVEAYVDGIAASAASFLIMACQSVNMYEGTMLMVHKPISVCIGNSDDMLKCASTLEDIQEGTCMPLYRAKLKTAEDTLTAMIAEEKWLSAREAARVFDINIVSEHKELTQMDASVFAKYGYKNVPEQLIKVNATAKAEQISQETTGPLDYSDLENRIKNLGGRR